MWFLFRRRQGDNFWEKEHPLLANAPEKHCTFAVDDVEEEPTIYQKSDAPPADMEKQQALKNIRGRRKIFIEKDCARSFHCED